MTQNHEIPWEIPFHVIGRKYTDSLIPRLFLADIQRVQILGHMCTKLEMYMYIEGEAWQEPLHENRVTLFQTVQTI